MIDKIIGSLPYPIAREEIIRRATQKGLALKPRHLKSTWALEFTGVHPGFYLLLGRHQKANLIRKFMSRPSACPSFKYFLADLENIFTPEEIQYSEITRIVFASDYDEPFQSIFAGLDIIHKQRRGRYCSKGSKITGFEEGSGSEVFVIYDKGAEQGLPEKSWTRIETRLSGSKLPARKIDDLPKLALAGCNGTPITPFRKVVLNSITFSPERDLKSIADLKTM